jgi:hypothetical protein
MDPKTSDNVRYYLLGSVCFSVYLCASLFFLAEAFGVSLF